MLHAIYFILLEAAVCGIMINRILTSKSYFHVHLPLYIAFKTTASSVMFFVNGAEFITFLGISISFLYAVLCFSDNLKRKITVIVSGTLCLALSNVFKFSFLSKYGLTQELSKSQDVLVSVICISFSLLLFTAFTIIVTNLLCRAKIKAVIVISGVMLLVLTFCVIVYSFMHSTITPQLNSIFSIYALVYLLPAIVLIYFSEALMFSGKEIFSENKS